MAKNRNKPRREQRRKRIVDPEAWEPIVGTDLPPIAPFKCKHDVYPHTSCVHCKYLGRRSWPEDKEKPVHLFMCDHGIYPQTHCTICEVTTGGTGPRAQIPPSTTRRTAPAAKKRGPSYTADDDCRDLAFELFGSVYVTSTTEVKDD